MGVVKSAEFIVSVRAVADTVQGINMLRGLYQVTGIHDPIIVVDANRNIDTHQMMINTGMQRAYLYIRQHLTQEQIAKIESK